MTKESYLEMCEMMGSEPIDEEIPLDFNDLYVDVQEALGIYFKLKDEWDTMNGNYLGKNYSGIKDIFQILDVPVEDWRTLFDLLGLIDRYRTKVINDNKPKSSPDKAPK